MKSVHRSLFASLGASHPSDEPPARNISVVLKVALVLLALAAPASLHAATVSGTVKDPSGAVIPDARIEITGGGFPQPLVFNSDAQGKFSSPDLQPGKYVVRVTHDGFEPLEKSVDLTESVELQLALTIARQQTNILVPGQALAVF